MDETERICMEEVIARYLGHTFLNRNLNAQFLNDDSMSEHGKAFAWFDSNIARLKSFRDLRRFPWYWYMNTTTKKWEPPLYDFIYRTDLWPRHIKRWVEMRQFLFLIDHLYHAICMNEFFELRDMPQYGVGHVGVFTREKVSYGIVEKHIIGILEHLETWDFNVFLANGVCSLMQSETDEHLGEGKFLFYFLAYCNQSEMSPFVFMDKVYSKETKYKLSRTLPIKFKLPVFDGHRDYRDLGLGTKENWLDWKFKKFIIYDGVKLKFKGSATTQFLEPNTEVTVRYDASNKSIKRRSQNSALFTEKIIQEDGLQKLINAAHIVSGYPEEADNNNKNNKSRNKKGTPEIKYNIIIIIIIVVLPYNC